MVSPYTPDHRNTHVIRATCNYDGWRDVLYDRNNLAMSSLLTDTHKHPLLPKQKNESMREKPYSSILLMSCVHVFLMFFWDPDGQTKS